eukprot:ANDGO_06835.mRNA.1 Tubulin-folding cofactor C
MGCFFSKEAEQVDIVYRYSYECEPIAGFLERAQISDASAFQMSKLSSQTVVRPPGSIGGQAFAIEECTDCDIFLTDHIASINIDECTNCRLFIGPTAGPVFLRNCVGCVCIVACQQFRTRDCSDCTLLLYAANRPIIEESRNMKIGCFSFFYFNLRAQFNAAKLSIYNNTWWNVYDFTPSNSVQSCVFLSLEEMKQVATGFRTLASVAPEYFSGDEVDICAQTSVVPYTIGKAGVDHLLDSSTPNVRLLVLFPPKFAADALKLVARCDPQTSHMHRAREILFSSDQFAQLFAFQGLKRAAGNRKMWLEGPSIGVELTVPSVDLVQTVLQEMFGKHAGDVCLDANLETADYFFERLPESV